MARRSKHEASVDAEREANVKQALASSMVSGPRFARPCTVFGALFTWRQLLASSVSVKRDANKRWRPGVWAAVCFGVCRQA
jgi:hypothetical protein